MADPESPQPDRPESDFDLDFDLGDLDLDEPAGDAPAPPAPPSGSDALSRDLEALLGGSSQRENVRVSGDRADAEPAGDEAPDTPPATPPAEESSDDGEPAGEIEEEEAPRGGDEGSNSTGPEIEVDDQPEDPEGDREAIDEPIAEIEEDLPEPDAPDEPPASTSFEPAKVETAAPVADDGGPADAQVIIDKPPAVEIEDGGDELEVVFDDPEELEVEIDDSPATEVSADLDDGLEIELADGAPEPAVETAIDIGAGDDLDEITAELEGDDLGGGEAIAAKPRYQPAPASGLPAAKLDDEPERPGAPGDREEMPSRLLPRSSHELEALGDDIAEDDIALPEFDIEAEGRSDLQPDGDIAAIDVDDDEEISLPDDLLGGDTPPESDADDEGEAAGDASGRKFKLPAYKPLEWAGIAAVLVACFAALLMLARTVTSTLDAARAGEDATETAIPSKIGGELVQIAGVKAYWRDRRESNRARKGSEILPVIEIASGSGSGYLQILVKDEADEIRGDGHTFRVSGGQFAPGGSSVVAVATDGLSNEVQFAAYRDDFDGGEDDYWTVTFRESADGNPPWADLARCYLPADRAEPEE